MGIEVAPKVPNGIGELWRKYAVQYVCDGEYEIDNLVRFVIEVSRVGYDLNVDDVELLVSDSGIRWENEDKIADEVDAIKATLRILADEYKIEGLFDDRT